MKFKVGFVFLVATLIFQSLFAQDNWPRTLTTRSGSSITIYQPQPEKLSGDSVTGRAAVSAKAAAKDEPVFGVVWYNATIVTNRDTRMVTLKEIKITDVKLPGVNDSSRIDMVKTFLEVEIPKWHLEISLDKILASIEEESEAVSENLNTDPPKIIFKKELSSLVLIDGEPKVQKDDRMNMNRVINTAYLIVMNPDDKKYYLYYGGLWYTSKDINAWAPVTQLKGAIKDIDKSIKDQEAKTENKPPKTEKDANGKYPKIVVSTTPAELIQSKGEPDFKSITGTELLYVANSEDYIFMHTPTQKYFILISGRWYTSASMEGGWAYVASDKLPGDFKKIPEGSEKDGALASVAGTNAAKEAVQDAQVPQTAKVDRSKATCSVKYDGEPKFEQIEGTNLTLAQNTSSTVLKEGNKYYAVENGVWFVSENASGPWKVSDERPKDTDKIPASSSANNVKYVYIYESTPEYVYVGYTPAYMGCYVYGPTVVYGTGFYYSPWYGPYYYPRPVTYGFSMGYNPWTGFTMGFHVSTGPFTFSIYGGGYGGYYGGYWGPPMYRPPYYPPYHPGGGGGGYYRPRPTPYGGNSNINADRTNNLYNRQNGVSTNDVKRGPQASTRDNRNPAASQRPANSNNIFAGRDGNVYQRGSDGGWQQRNNSRWNQTPSTSQMDRQYQNRNRGNERAQSFQNTNRGGNMGGNFNRGGGARMGGGGRRR